MAFGSATLDEVALLIKNKDLQSAEAKAEMLFKLNNDFVSALLFSYVKFMLGKYDESIQTGFKAMRLAKNKEDSDLSMFLIAAAHVQKGSQRDARDVVKTFAKPDSFWGTYLDMIFLLSEGKGEEAARQIDKLIGKDKALALKLLEGMVTKKS